MWNKRENGKIHKTTGQQSSANIEVKILFLRFNLVVCTIAEE